MEATGVYRRIGVFALAAAVVVGLGLAAPAHADDYPSWDDVQAAKSNAAAAKAEVDTITAVVAQLQASANAAAAAELKKAADYTTAKNALDAATLRSNDLQAASTQAADAAASARKRFGQLVSQLYMSGGTDFTTQLLLSGPSTDDLLAKLGAMHQLSGHSSQLQMIAVQKQNIADASAQQAVVAKKLRDQLATAAAQKLAAAQAAQQAADAELAKQQTVSATLYAQAAALNNTQASVEKQYYDGVARREALQAATEAAGNGSSDNVYIDTTGVVVDPAAAQAYARGAIGGYGWGDDQFSCLVSLWNGESGWRANAYNPSSGAYGIPQSWPGYKMATAGADWRTNANTQINWGLSYISSAYGSPCAAWDTWQARSPHWY
jgi:peptidoglycan DL-endopeptidase CwlO